MLHAVFRYRDDSTMALRAATRCICLRFGLVDRNGTATYFGAMQLGDGLLGIPVDRHFNEAKPLGLTGIAIDEISTLSTCPNWLNTFVSSSAVIRYDRLPT